VKGKVKFTPEDSSQNDVYSGSADKRNESQKSKVKWLSAQGGTKSAKGLGSHCRSFDGRLRQVPPDAHYL
jgi:hypothetical protein